jgi:hypothetical protein
MTRPRQDALFLHVLGQEVKLQEPKALDETEQQQREALQDYRRAVYCRCVGRVECPLCAPAWARIRARTAALRG